MGEDNINQKQLKSNECTLWFSSYEIKSQYILFKFCFYKIRLHSNTFGSNLVWIYFERSNKTSFTIKNKHPSSSGHRQRCLSCNMKLCADYESLSILWKNTYSYTVLIVGMQANLTCRLHLIALNSIVIVCMHRVCKVESLSYLSYFTISNVIAPQFICIDEALLGYINILHIRFPSSMNIVCYGVFLMQYKVGRRCYTNIGQEKNCNFNINH